MGEQWQRALWAAISSNDLNKILVRPSYYSSSETAKTISALSFFAKSDLIGHQLHSQTRIRSPESDGSRESEESFIKGESQLDQHEDEFSSSQPHGRKVGTAHENREKHSLSAASRVWNPVRS